MKKLFIPRRTGMPSFAKAMRTHEVIQRAANNEPLSTEEAAILRRMYSGKTVEAKFEFEPK